MLFLPLVLLRRPSTTDCCDNPDPQPDSRPPRNRGSMCTARITQYTLQHDRVATNRELQRNPGSALQQFATTHLCNHRIILAGLCEGARKGCGWLAHAHGSPVSSCACTQNSTHGEQPLKSACTVLAHLNFYNCISLPPGGDERATWTRSHDGGWGRYPSWGAKMFPSLLENVVISVSRVTSHV
jgi:hypothetical protein